MTIYGGTIAIYESWKEQIGKAPNLASDVFKMLLVTSSYVPDLAFHSVLSDVSGEVTGSGYVQQTLGNVTFSQSLGTAKFDFDDPVFSASGGNWTARRWIIYDDSVAVPLKPLIAVGLIDSADMDVLVTDSNTLTFNVNAAGLFTLS